MSSPADTSTSTQRTGVASTPRRSRLVSRAGVLGWLLGSGALALVVLVVVLLAGGGSPQPSPVGLPDAGPVTGWALPVTRMVADLAGIATLGLLMAAGVLLPSPAKQLRWVPFLAVRTASWTALLWALAVACQTALTLSDILGTRLPDALAPTYLRSFLFSIPTGRALVIQLVLALAVAAAARVVATTKGAALVTLLALVTLTPPVLTGHSAESGNHDLAVSSLLVHVVAAAVWVGGLGALAWAAALDSGRGDGLRLAVPRYSRIAAWCFVAVALSGIVNAGVRLGALGPLFSSSYGVLVLAKAAALVTLGGFGWWHRRRTVAQVAGESAGETAGGTGGGTSGSGVRLFLRVAASELVVMGATVALAVGLSRTPTPVGDTVNTSPAAELLGFALPPEPTLSRILLGFNADGFAITFVVLAALAYATGLRSLHSRGHRWPVGRTLAWYAGLLVFAWATFGGLGLYSHVMFSWHMVAHMTLTMIAPIGLVLGAPVTLALRTLPGGRTRDEDGPRQLLLAVLHSRLLRVLAHPLVALALWVGSLYALYFTGLFPLLMGSHLGHIAMEFHFVGVGSLFFWTLIGVDPTPYRWHPFAKIGMLVAAMPFHAFFSIALLSSDTVLDRGYYRTLARPYATSLLTDEHLGGGIGWALSEVPVVLVVAAIFVQWVRADHREAVRLDRAADRAADRSAARVAAASAGAGAAGVATSREPDEDPLSAYNAYLARLSAHDSSGRRD